MTLPIAIERRLESKLAGALEVMGLVNDHLPGLDGVGTKGMFTKMIRSPITGQLEPISKWLEAS